MWATTCSMAAAWSSHAIGVEEAMWLCTVAMMNSPRPPANPAVHDLAAATRSLTSWSAGSMPFTLPS